MLKKNQLLVPENPNRSTGLINGVSSGILNWNDLQNDEHYEIYRRLMANFWMPDEINMSKDSSQWMTLSEDEKEAFLNTIALLAILDSVQPRFLSSVKEYLTDTSASAILSIIEQQEVVHNQSYSYILASVEHESVQNRAFEMARTHEPIYRRNKLILDIYEEFRSNPSIMTLIKALSASIVLEGINFYAGFAFFYNLARNQKMVGTSTMISYINRDELQHAHTISLFLKNILAENPLSPKEAVEFETFVKEFFMEAVRLEIEWSNYSLAKITDIDLDELADYIKYRANKCLSMIGFGEIYEGVDENSMIWIKAHSDGSANTTKSDFFEQKSRSYAKVTEKNGFDEL